jgi:ATP-dependent helicase/nuclease subunit A
MGDQQKNLLSQRVILPSIPSTWVMAHAGSGKTYRLIWRVVGLLLRDVTPESIWCVTYTNAAAAEMDARLIALLKAMHLADDAGLLEMLSGPLPECATAEHIPVARSLFARIQQRPHGGVRFTTMHGLCQWLLRAFPLEAGISEHATLLEPEDATTMRRDAIRQICAANLDDASALAHARAHIISVANFDHALAMIEKAIQKQANMQPHFVREPEAMSQDYYGALGIADPDGRAALHASFIQHDGVALAPAIAMLCESRNANDRAFGALLDQWVHADITARESMLGAYLGGFLTSTMAPRKRLFTKQSMAEDSAAAGLLRREQQRVYDYAQQRAAYALAEDSVAIQRMAQAASDAYQSSKAAADVLDYDDLLRVAYGLLSSPDMMPWVMHRLDYRLEHLLIDEAQDTSPIQWRMIGALCEEIIAQSEQAGQPKTLFVVGDVKQSIYSFQGAAPHWLPRMYAELSSRLPHGIERETLDVSYRSSGAVLDWVNALCADADIASSLADQGPVPHRLHHRDAYGRIECWPTSEATPHAPLAPYHMPVAPIEAQTADAALAEQIASELDTRLLGMPLRGKPLRPGDVMILVRTRTALVGYINAALMRRGIPVAGLDRLRLAEHPAVHDCMALFAWCLQPNDDMALAQLMMSPLLDMSQETLLECAAGRGDIALWEAVQRDHPAVATQLRAWQEHAREGAYGLLQHVLVRDKKTRAFSRRMGEDSLNVLDELLLYVQAKDEAHQGHIAHLLHALERESPELKREQHSGVDSEENAVRIMTVHGAKGLQAPLVILADTTRMPSLQQEQLYMDETGCWAALQSESAYADQWGQLKADKKKALTDEYYRLLYVAATRAADMLVVAGSGTPAAGCWYEVMARHLRALGPEKSASGMLYYESGIHQTAGAPPPESRKLLAVPSWLSAPVTFPELPLSLRPSYVGNEEGHATDMHVAPQSEGDPQAYGNCFHALMEWADASVNDEEIQAFARLHAQDAERLLREFRALWAAADIAALLSLDAAREQDIRHRTRMNEKEYVFSGQIDRLIIRDTECIILDYKTALAPPSTMPEAYKTQLISYALMMQRALPTHRVRAGLLWTANATLDWLAESDVTDAEAYLYDMALT